MGKDLRAFLQLIKKAGPDFYVEAKKPLKPELEVGILQHKLASEGRFPAIYCPKIEGSNIPLVTNLFGSLEMYALAFDLDPRTAEKSQVLKEYMRRMDRLIKPQLVHASEAPVKEVILKEKDADLTLLPVLKHAEMNSGKYMTMNPFICRDPMTGISNVGIYRHEVRGRDELAAQIHPANHGAIIARRYAELNKPMEAVIISGHHPAAMRVEVVGYRQYSHLNRRQPKREISRVMFHENSKEPLNGTQQSPVDHIRPLPLAVAVSIIQIEPLRQGEIKLDS